MESNQDNGKGVRISRLGAISLGFGILSPLVPLAVGLLDPYFAITGVLGLAAGIAALLQIHMSRGAIRGRLYASLGILTSGAWVGLILWRMVIPAVIEARHFAAREPAFAGPSTQLSQTILVPTLDIPAPPGNNVIWCSSFELAWDRLKDDVIKEPIQLAEANDLAQLLNNANVSASDVKASDCYTAAGLVRDNIVGNIAADMKATFPDAIVPKLQTDDPEAIIAYAYLEAHVKFQRPYRDYPYEFLFYDSHNHKTAVAAFGFWAVGTVDDETAEQAELLYYSEGRVQDGNTIENADFVVDLCRTSMPYQIVAAAVRPEDTLAKTLAQVDRKVKEYAEQKGKPYLAENNAVLVPDAFYSVGHHFEQLEGDMLVNPGFKTSEIVQAVQDVRFRLDRGGASLKSAAYEVSAALKAKTPIACVFNRPFLLYMKNRGAQRPFFVMWVDNAELLTMRQ